MKYEYWFSGIRNIPDRTKIKLKEKAGTAEAIYYIEETVLRKMQLLKEQEIWKILEAKKEEGLDRNYEAMRQKGISVIPWGEKEYPGRLKEIYDPPYALYVKGKLPDDTARAAAIVGARSCTPYGEKYALEYGKKLAECGIQVISGLARGVDGIGQRGALRLFYGDGECGRKFEGKTGKKEGGYDCSQLSEGGGRRFRHRDESSAVNQ